MLQPYPVCGQAYPKPGTDKKFTTINKIVINRQNSLIFDRRYGIVRLNGKSITLLLQIQT